LKSFKPHIAGATAVTMTFDHAKQVLKNVKTMCARNIGNLSGTGRCCSG
jgi:hypothetical protein